MPSNHYDLVIIGAGSGNSLPGPDMDTWRIAIVERDLFGGTCLNRGCIPTKMMVYAADVAEVVRESERYGLRAEVESVDWPSIVQRVFGRIDPIAASGEQYRRSLANVDVFATHARFVGPKQLDVGTDGAPNVITADRFVLAAGARSVIPDIAGLENVEFHTSDTIMRIPALPRRVVIVGGGFIASEFGHVFDALGSTVTIVQRGPRLLMAEDREISQRFTDLMAKRMTVHCGSAVMKVGSLPEGGVTMMVDTPQGSTVIEADVLLIATGRRPNGDDLAVEATGVRLDDRGRVITDRTGATGVEGIWALGDIVGRHQLKHMANLEARIVAHNLVHPDRPKSIDDRAAPHAVFSSPQIGAVGVTEEEAAKSGRPYVVARRDYAGAAYGWALEDTTSFAKVIGDPTTGLLIGAHIVGPQAASLVQLLVQGMHLGNTVEQMARDVIYIHPALTEVVEQALLALVDEMSQWSPA